MKICIVGGAGYIGSHVVRAFADQGYDVWVYDNLSTGTRDNLFDDTTFVEGDILDYDRLCDVLGNGFDGLVHLAAFKAAGESMSAPEKYAHNNIIGTVNIVNAAARASIPAIVFSSSAAVYGEPQYTPIDERHPLAPANFYGFTKLEIERLLAWFERLRGIRYAALRYFNAAGYDVQGRICGLENAPQNLLPVIMEVAAGWRKELQVFGTDYDTPDGTCIRDYVHVSDLADAHVAAFTYIRKNGCSLTLNLGSDTGMSVTQMVSRARDVLPRDIPVRTVQRRPGDPAALVASSTRAREILGWHPRHSDARSILTSTWHVYEKHL